MSKKWFTKSREVFQLSERVFLHGVHQRTVCLIPFLLVSLFFPLEEDCEWSCFNLRLFSSGMLISYYIAVSFHQHDCVFINTCLLIALQKQVNIDSVCCKQNIKI